jgi:putative acetyltransferase
VTRRAEIPALTNTHLHGQMLGRYPDPEPGTGFLKIRPELPTDADAVGAVNQAAFETNTEADLVELLHRQASPLISLVADDAGSVVGHILFSPAMLLGHPNAKIMGLAPMAVLPAHQRMGIGSSLVRAGLEACRQLGFGAVVVLGHAKYYPRFGFQPASRFGLRCEYEVPDEVFMALELEAGTLGGMTGTIQYHPAFAQV